MRVLIVEDTKTLLTLIQIYLMGWGFEFVEAQDGREALEKARKARPDLVITDVCMPGMDGFELTAAIRRDAALQRVPVVMLTTLKDDASREKGRRAGATAFLSKPVSVEELRGTVSDLLHLSGKKG